MAEEKRNTIYQFLEEHVSSQRRYSGYAGTIKEMMEAEMDVYLGYEKLEHSNSDDYWNGYKRKRVNGCYDSMEIEVPQDRKLTFEFQVVKKRQKDISDIEQTILSMYPKEMITRQISETIEESYGFETSEGFISDAAEEPSSE